MMRMLIQYRQKFNGEFATEGCNDRYLSKCKTLQGVLRQGRQYRPEDDFQVINYKTDEVLATSIAKVKTQYKNLV